MPWCAHPDGGEAGCACGLKAIIEQGEAAIREAEAAG